MIGSWKCSEIVKAERGRGETCRGPVRAAEVKGRIFGAVQEEGALAGGAGQLGGGMRRRAIMVRAALACGMQ